MNDNQPRPSAAAFPWELIRALPGALRFLTRLPIPRLPFETAGTEHAAPDIATLAPALPVAGALVGAAGAAMLGLGLLLGLTPFLASTLAFATMIAITGAFHEDGLADLADGMGGMNPERRLSIMKDSRVGSFGVLALVVSVLLRVGALDALVERAPALAAAGLIAAAGASRVAGLFILHALPPARADGIARAAGVVPRGALFRAARVSLFLAAALVLPGFGPIALALALAFASVATAGIARLARVLLGGQTGDVAGAATQLAEIAFLLGLLMFAQPS
ncbi:adenosylcobinamide-GDP ribazoletransferase [Ancylobacter sp. 6x-1]|uniref:Adenosylcobinamide-GDP ribazoletransferase n=1 Tax=Ancylobacter crimeensis TaxID=2579147 RepID=A0ABT0D8B6_9HYPH|nr:adenosylcobinamide-GDP ribazoletransferase [Ancylobacter crimeensis]MCK0196191.1 adenosylcobinamide-GDP ribazoletransferase [Ancylobacter crimeensis]